LTQQEELKAKSRKLKADVKGIPIAIGRRKAKGFLERKAESKKPKAEVKYIPIAIGRRKAKGFCMFFEVPLLRRGI
jgi:hypothetical protein